MLNVLLVLSCLVLMQLFPPVYKEEIEKFRQNDFLASVMAYYRLWSIGPHIKAPRNFPCAVFLGKTLDSQSAPVHHGTSCLKGSTTIHRQNIMCYPLDSDLSSRQRYPPFEQLGPSVLNVSAS